jgi:hypothetical protein
MTSDTKKPSSPKPIRLIDERDQAWSSLNAMVAGMSPEERSQALQKFVESLPSQEPKK